VPTILQATLRSFSQKINVNRECLTNSSVRERFGIDPRNIPLSSRLIKEAVGTGAILPYDPKAAPKMMK